MSKGHLYDHQAIEKKWAKRWQEADLYSVDVSEGRDKYYCLDMFPYPSAYNLHVGHWRGYVLSDYYSRHAMLHGKRVLHPMGFDSFGLNAENAAIKHKSHPNKFTQQAITEMLRQFKEMGASFDWSKYISTCDPSYYHWTQWLFLQLFKHGFVEKRKSLVNWCPTDQTVLANEQVVGGVCERCGTAVTKKELSQWFVKTTEFADELLAGLDDVDWPERTKKLQRDWIGKSEGTLVRFESSAGNIEVFTTRVDTIFGVTALVLSPEHPLVEKLTIDGQKKAVEEYLKEVHSKTDVARQQNWEKEKSAVFTGSTAKHPLTGREIPVWIADYVLMSYGTGAVMSVPAHDERDYRFAKQYTLPINHVIVPLFHQKKEPGVYKKDKETIETDGVICLVKHWAEDKYIGLKWKTVDWGTLLTGTIDSGMTPEQTALKELKEETGYTNAKITAELGLVDGLFFHVPKDKNKLVHAHIFVIELGDDARDEVSDEEKAKHEIEWLTIDELRNFLTPPTHQYAINVLKNGIDVVSDDGTLMGSSEFSGLKIEEAQQKITAKLISENKGEKNVVYKLRDWLVSRQRYWGAPIPIVYDPDGKPYAVKEEHLPLHLPNDVDFLPGGESPIARSGQYKKLAEKLYGKGWHFDTDTLDTFVDSSWYFLRYLSPTDDQKAFNKELVGKWLPVDLYIGGVEHATLHLLYARFMTRFLAKYSYIDPKITEPFKRLFNIGMITMHGAKMSKSKGNVVSPDLLIEHYGTDALRGLELFVGPMDIEAEWNNHGMNGIHRFLIRLYQKYSDVNGSYGNDDLDDEFSVYLGDINDMIKSFRTNTIIAEYMKFLNLLEQRKPSQKILENFLITMSPAYPFIAEELWENMGHKDSIFHGHWPTHNKIVRAAEIKVLVNQKFIETLVTDVTDEQKVIEAAKGLPLVAQKLSGKKIGKTIYRQGELVNFLVGL